MEERAGEVKEMVAKTSNMRKKDGILYFSARDREIGKLNIDKCERSYGKIVKPYFGFGGFDGAFVGLHLTLNMASGTASWLSLYRIEEIEAFMHELGVRQVEHMEGKVVEVLLVEPYNSAAVTINRNLL